MFCFVFCAVCGFFGFFEGVCSGLNERVVSLVRFERGFGQSFRSVRQKGRGYDCVSERVLWYFESVRVEGPVKGGGWARSSKAAAGRDGREGFKGQVGAVIEDFGAVELGCQRVIGQG